MIKPLHLMLLAATLGVAACSKPAPAPDPIRSVKLITVGMQPIQASLEFAGEVRARVESKLAFRVSGKLSVRSVELGQQVKAGQLLGQLDVQDFKLAQDASRAQLALAQTNRDLAASDFKRFAAMKEQNFISGAELERRESVLKAAQAQLEQAQTQMTAQGNQAAYASLHADAAGVVTGVMAEPGQVLLAGTPVVQMAYDGPRDVVFAVPEDKLAGLKPGSEVQILAWSGNQSVLAKVREIAASADPVTRTFLIKAALPGGQGMALGSTVTAVPKSLQRTGTQVIKLPTSALRQEGQDSAVWVYDAASMTVKSQIVQIATADGNDVVVAGGLLPGAQVVIAGVHVLSAGQKVTVYKENMPSALVGHAQSTTVNVAPAK
jgi:RND family efflux transporter MFP subunit